MKPEKFWDMLAKGFDKGDQQFEQIHRQTLENAKKYLQKTDVVLDYGCATGTKTIEIAGNVKMVYAIDISSKMIEIAKRKALENKIENIDFAHTQIDDGNYHRESFDVILAFNILHLLDDNRKTMQRISELLKPGGLFISATPCLGEKMMFFTSLQFYVARLLMYTGLIQPIKRFKSFELENLIADENLQLVETKKLVHKLTNHFMVARKI